MKRLLVILSLFLVVSVAKSQSSVAVSADSLKSSVQIDSSSSSLLSSIPSIDWKQLLDYASLYLGTPYHYGGMSVMGFDCSGFISYVFNYFGISLPHSSYGMAQLGVKVAKDQLQVGDLVFFSGRRSGGIGHVGMIVETGDNVLKMISASCSRGVAIDDINLSDYWRARYITARRLLMGNSGSTGN